MLLVSKNKLNAFENLLVLFEPKNKPIFPDKNEKSSKKRWKTKAAQLESHQHTKIVQTHKHITQTNANKKYKANIFF